jgi:chromosome partitioning protein
MLDWFKRISAPVPSEPAVENEKMVERLMDRLATSGRSSEEPAPMFRPVFDQEPVEDEVLELSHDMKIERPADPVEVCEEPAAPSIAVSREPSIDNDKVLPGNEQNVQRLMPRVAASSKASGEVAGGSSQMKIIAVASQKGGCGKTTIAAHLAVRAGMVGQGPAVLIDTDPQHSLTEWWQARADDSLALVTVKLDDLPGSLATLRSQGAAVAIIDTPPALTASIERVIALADLVLIPARPSPHDLRAIGATVEMTRRAGKPFVFVVNGAAPRASITAEAVAALSEHGRVAPGILYQRTDFAASMIDGRTVMEAAPNSRSAQEIAELWKCVHAQISMRAAA